MFNYDSRYYDLETVNMETGDGRVLSYKKRRFLPGPNDFDIQKLITVTQGMRPDLIASQNLGDSEQFWQLCDANGCMNPFDLTADIGRKIKIGTRKIRVQ